MLQASLHTLRQSRLSYYYIVQGTRLDWRIAVRSTQHWCYRRKQDLNTSHVWFDSRNSGYTRSAGCPQPVSQGALPRSKLSDSGYSLVKEVLEPSHHSHARYRGLGWRSQAP